MGDPPSNRELISFSRTSCAVHPAPADAAHDPGPPRLADGQILESILMPPMGRVHVEVRDERQRRRTEEFLASRRYWASPFQIVEFPDSAVAVDAGLVFDRATRRIADGTIYGPVRNYAGFIERDESGAGRQILSLEIEKCAASRGAVVDRGGEKVFLPFHRYASVHTHALLETLFSIVALYDLDEDPGRFTILLNATLYEKLEPLFKICEVPLDRILIVPQGGIVTGRVFTSPTVFSGTWYHPSIVHLRDRIARRRIHGSLPLPTRFYISRRDALERPLENEPVIEQLARRLGFTPVVLTEWDVVRQMALFTRARQIVGCHGSGLANIVVADCQASVLEIMPYGIKGRYPLLHAAIRRVASAAGLDYEICVAAGNENESRWSLDTEYAESVLSGFARKADS